MPTDWRTALFAQARSNYELLKLLSRENAPLCPQLHYLQMATEKLAKGFSTPPGGPQPPKVHRAFVNFMRSVHGSRTLRQACHCGPGQIEAYIDLLLPLARLIEDLAPANASDGPKPEYPWQIPAGIIAPVHYPFTNLQFQNRNMLNMLKFLERCFQII